jgi:hypothetical protein
MVCLRCRPFYLPSSLKNVAIIFSPLSFQVKPAVIQVLIWCGPGPPRPLNHAAADSPPRSDLQFSQWPDPARIIHLIRTLKAKFFRWQDGPATSVRTNLFKCNLSAGCRSQGIPFCRRRRRTRYAPGCTSAQSCSKLS